MNNEETKKAILKDIYAAEPELKKREQELLQIIDEMLEAKPEVKLDETFKQELKAKLLQNTKNDAASKAENPGASLWNFMSTTKKFALGGSFLVIVFLIAGMIYVGNFYKTEKIAVQEKVIDDRQPEKANILPREEAAFGDLSGDSFAQAPALESPELSEEAWSASPQLESSGGIARDESLSRSVIAPPSRFAFKYQGKDISINQNKSEVLRRIKDGGLGPFEELISSFKIDMVDFESFSNVQLQSFSFAESSPFGFVVNVNNKEGSISLNQNWEMWNLGCVDDYCPQRELLIIADLPADDIIVKIADEFVQKHGINMTNFEKGTIDEAWKRQLQTSPETSFAPVTISVIYPLKIEGRKIYSTAGKREGLTVQVNVSHLRVSGMYGLTTQNYESSLYDTEDDFNRIVQIAERGGSLYAAPALEMEPDIRKVELALGTPTFASVKYWHYENNKNNELIVPALIFPIINAREKGYFQDNIVVPLITDLLR